jgi:hypothetical protein
MIQKIQTQLLKLINKKACNQTCRCHIHPNQKTNIFVAPASTSDQCAIQLFVRGAVCNLHDNYRMNNRIKTPTMNHKMNRNSPTSTPSDEL